MNFLHEWLYILDDWCILKIWQKTPADASRICQEYMNNVQRVSYMSSMNPAALTAKNTDERIAALCDDPDIKWGMPAIGRAIGIQDRRAAYHFITTRNLKSVRKVGGRWCASKRELLKELFGSAEGGDAA